MMFKVSMWVPLIGVIAFLGGTSHADEYPNKPIRIVTAPPGGSADLVSRIIASSISSSLGKQVIVENRGGVIPGQLVAKAQPDGYTLLLSGSLWITPFFQRDVPWRLSDFSPITLAVSAPNAIVVHPSLPAKSVRELIAIGKSSVEGLNYGSAGTGTSSHLAAELFKSMTGVNIVHVPHKGTGPALNDLVGGHLQIMFVPVASAAPYTRSGRLRALAVTSEHPSILAPELPTVADSGVPKYFSVTVLGIFLPANAPADIVRRLNGEIVRAINRADVKETLSKAGLEAAGTTPEQFAAYMKSEMDNLSNIVFEGNLVK